MGTRLAGLDNAIKRMEGQNFFSTCLSSDGLQSKCEHRLIDVAPTPLLSTFNGAHQWMAGRMKVFCSVFVL